MLNYEEGKDKVADAYVDVIRELNQNWDVKFEANDAEFRIFKDFLKKMKLM